MGIHGHTQVFTSIHSYIHMYTQVYTLYTGQKSVLFMYLLLQSL